MHRRVIEEPVVAGVLEVLTIAFSAILVDLADVSPAGGLLSVAGSRRRPRYAVAVE
jgi:hypothetical protein